MFLAEGRVPYKTYLTITSLYIDFSNSRFARVIINLCCPLGENIGGPSMKVCTLLGIREILCTGNLEFPTLLNKGEDCERIVAHLVAVDGVKHA